MDLASLLFSLLLGQASVPARADAPPVERPAVAAPFVRPLWPPLVGG